MVDPVLLLERLRKLTAEKTHMLGKIRKSERNAQSLKQLTETLRQNLDVVSRENKELVKENSNLKETTLDWQHQNYGIREELKRCQTSMERLRMQVYTFKNQMDGCQADSNAAIEEADTVKKETILKYREKVQRNEKKIQEVLSTQHELYEDLQNSETKLDEVGRKPWSLLKGNIESLLQRAKIPIEKADSIIAEAITKQKLAEQKYAMLVQETCLLNQNLENRTEQLNKIERDLDHKQKALDEMRKFESEALLKINFLSSSNKTLREQLEDQTMKNRDFERQIRILQLNTE